MNGDEISLLPRSCLQLVLNLYHLKSETTLERTIRTYHENKFIEVLWFPGTFGQFSLMLCKLKDLGAALPVITIGISGVFLEFRII